MVMLCTSSASTRGSITVPSIHLRRRLRLLLYAPSCTLIGGYGDALRYSFLILSAALLTLITTLVVISTKNGEFAIYVIALSALLFSLGKFFGLVISQELTPTCSAGSNQVSILANAPGGAASRQNRDYVFTNNPLACSTVARAYSASVSSDALLIGWPITTNL